MHRYKAALIRMTMLGLATIVPPWLFAIVVWQFSLYNESQRLVDVDSLVIMRADETLRAVEDVLKVLASYNEEPCSATHMARMHELAVHSPAIQELAYTHNTGQKCVLWGQDSVFASQQAPTFTTSTGLHVTAGIEFSDLDEERILLLQYGQYEAMVREWRFTDVILYQPTFLALATLDGTVVAASPAFPQEALERIFKPNNAWQNPDYMLALEQKGQWLVAAMTPRQSLQHYVTQNRHIMIPAVLIIAVLGFLCVLCWMVKPQPLKVALRLALQRRQLNVHYQPIMHLQTGVCVGAEALMRWRNEEGRWISPEEFVPAAEQSGQMQALTNMLVERVASDMGAELQADRQLHISLNLSAHDISDQKIIALLKQSFLHQGVKAEQLWLEITERVSMDIDVARNMLNQAREAGYIVAIDDFGTGYSSLQYLQTLPVDILKIDKTFIHSIGTGSASSAVVTHIIEIAKSLGLVMVAEGVETQEQVEYLRDCGVDFAQGWFYSKALEGKAFQAFYADHRTPDGKAPWPTDHSYYDNHLYGVVTAQSRKDDSNEDVCP